MSKKTQTICKHCNLVITDEGAYGWRDKTGNGKCPAQAHEPAPPASTGEKVVYESAPDAPGTGEKLWNIAPEPAPSASMMCHLCSDVITDVNFHGVGICVSHAAVPEPAPSEGPKRENDETLQLETMSMPSVSALEPPAGMHEIRPGVWEGTQQPLKVDARRLSEIAQNFPAPTTSADSRPADPLDNRFARIAPQYCDTHKVVHKCELMLAAPSTESVQWTVDYLTKLRNAVFATIPDELKGANCSDDALLAWPAKLKAQIADRAQPDAGTLEELNHTDVEWILNINQQLDTLDAPRKDAEGNFFSINGRFAMLRTQRPLSPAQPDAETLNAEIKKQMQWLLNDSWTKRGTITPSEAEFALRELAKTILPAARNNRLSSVLDHKYVANECQDHGCHFLFLERGGSCAHCTKKPGNV